MSKLINLINQKFGQLIVIQRMNNDNWGASRWLCICGCGEETVVLGNNLRHSHTHSCGCLSKTNSVTHGYTKKRKITRIYSIWRNMRQRCNNYNHKNYNCYGGRGIGICDRWSKFKNFLKDMGEPPSGKHQIDRKKNNGNYCKSNCQWVTSKINNQNKRNNRMETYKGKTRCLSDWANETGVNVKTLVWRLNNGWTISKALIPFMNRIK